MIYYIYIYYVCVFLDVKEKEIKLENFQVKRQRMKVKEGVRV